MNDPTNTLRVDSETSPVSGSETPPVTKQKQSLTLVSQENEEAVWAKSARAADIEAQLVELSEHLNDSLSRQAALIEELRAVQTDTSGSLDAHGSRLNAFSQLTGRKLQGLSEQFAEATQRLQEQQSQLSTLSLQITEQDEVTRSLGGRLDEFVRRFADGQDRLGKRLTWSSLVFGLVLVAMGAAAGWYHLNPVAVPESVSAELANYRPLPGQISQMQADAASLVSSVSQLEGSMAGVDDRLNGLREEQVRLEGSTIGISDQLSGMGQALENLRLEIQGPGQVDAATSKPVLPVEGGEWIATRAPDSYTIQLAGFYRYQDLVNFVGQYKTTLEGLPLSFSAGKSAGRDWYNLYAGEFESLEAGLGSLNALPLRLQNNGPFLKAFSDIPR